MMFTCSAAELRGFVSNLANLSLSLCEIVRDRVIDAHFYSAASLKYHALDIWHDSTTSPSSTP